MDTDKTIEYYRSCFCTESGKRVLAHLLADMGLLDDNIYTPEDMAVRNYAVKILKRLGIVSPENLDYFADMFINAPVKLGKDSENG